MKAMGLFGGVQVMGIICSIVRTKLVAIWIGPVGVGLFGLFNNALEMLNTGTNLGIRGSSVRDISQAMASDDRSLIARIIVVVRRWSLWLGLGGALLTLMLSPLLSQVTFGTQDHMWGFVALSVAVLLIARRDATIGDATCADGVVANVDEEGAIARPTALAAGSHRHAEMSAPVLIEQLVPLVDRKIGIVASNMNATAEASFYGNIDSTYAIIGHRKVERRNVDGHGHADVVWEDVRLGACLSLVGRLRVAGNEQQPTEHAG